MTVKKIDMSDFSQEELFSRMAIADLKSKYNLSDLVEGQSYLKLINVTETVKVTILNYFVLCIEKDSNHEKFKTQLEETIKNVFGIGEDLLALSKKHKPEKSSH